MDSLSSSCVPSARVAGSAAGSVADVLTTSEVAGGEEARQVDEAGVLDRRAGRVGDEQPDVVAAAAARLGRLVRLEPVRQLERERAHADAPTSSRAR